MLAAWKIEGRACNAMSHILSLESFNNFTWDIWEAYKELLSSVYT